MLRMMPRVTRVHLVSITAMLGAIAVLIVFGQVARSRTFQLAGEIVQRVETRERRVALTFDDGPAAESLDSILTLLRLRNVKATFFVIGSALEEFPEASRKLVTEGHELGNHSYSHKRMVFRPPSFHTREIERTDSLIRATGHGGAIYFRPPYSYKFAILPLYLSRTNRVTVTWDIEPESFPEVEQSPANIVRHVLDRARPGSIILLHPWYPARGNTRNALGPLIDSLQARGYAVGPVRELIR